VMLHIIFGGSLWQKAESGNQHYDSLVKGWAKWDDKHPEDGSITETDYPFVTAFDQMVNPPALRRLLIRMLHPDPARRSTIDDVGSNRWLLKNVDCCQPNSYDDPATIVDASKKLKHSQKVGPKKIVHHNHLPPASHKGHHLVRLPGSTDMD
jgi:protein-serine/threonine kinase